MITLTEPCTMPEEQLTAPQQTALTSLILGKSMTAAAGEAGVHRNTLHRWLKNDEHFQEAQRKIQREARATIEAKLHDTAKAAVDCIDKCLREGDVYVAEQLLKGLGCFDGKLKNLGSEDVLELARASMQQSALGEMFGERGARSEIGGRKSAQAEREGVGGESESENLQPGATSPCRSRHPVPDNEATSPPPAPTSDLRHPTLNLQPSETPEEIEADTATRQAQPDLREMQRYASVFTTPDEANGTNENPQHGSPSDDSECNSPPSSGTECRDLPESDGITIEHAGHECEIYGYADLTTQQTLAMFALQTGQTVDEAAATAETESATVYQWLRGDHIFQAAMNRCAGERRQTIQSRLAQLASRAADVIDRKVCQGNGRMAFKVLKGLGYLAARRV